MTRGSWARSGKPRGVAPADPDVWSGALSRARREWEALTGDDGGSAEYSDVAAAAILTLAVALRPMVARELGRSDDDEGGPA